MENEWDRPRFEEWNEMRPQEFEIMVFDPNDGHRRKVQFRLCLDVAGIRLMALRSERNGSRRALMGPLVIEHVDSFNEGQAPGTPWKQPDVCMNCGASMEPVPVEKRQCSAHCCNSRLKRDPEQQSLIDEESERS